MNIIFQKLIESQLFVEFKPHMFKYKANYITEKISLCIHIDDLEHQVNHKYNSYENSIKEQQLNYICNSIKNILYEYFIKQIKNGILVNSNIEDTIKLDFYEDPYFSTTYFSSNMYEPYRMAYYHNNYYMKSHPPIILHELTIYKEQSYVTHSNTNSYYPPPQICNVEIYMSYPDDFKFIHLLTDNKDILKFKRKKAIEKFIK